MYHHRLAVGRHGIDVDRQSSRASESHRIASYSPNPKLHISSPSYLRHNAERIDRLPVVLAIVPSAVDLVDRPLRYEHALSSITSSPASTMRLTLVDAIGPGLLLERDAALVSVNRVGMGSSATLRRLPRKFGEPDPFASESLVCLLVRRDVHPAHCATP